MFQHIIELAIQSLAKLVTTFPKITIYEMGTWFCGTNKISKEVYKEQVHIGGHILCNKMDEGKNVKDKYCNCNNKNCMSAFLPSLDVHYI